jgi:hypothetical protein
MTRDNVQLSRAESRLGPYRPSLPTPAPMAPPPAPDEEPNPLLVKLLRRSVVGPPYPGRFSEDGSSDRPPMEEPGAPAEPGPVPHVGTPGVRAMSDNADFWSGPLVLL